MKRSTTSPQGIASAIRRVFLSRKWRNSELRSVNLVDSICGLSRAIEALVAVMQQEDAGGEEETETQ